ncbi:TonB-dependent receptor [Alkalimonas mucilaginosa]|uniref:TonB-dependent receptor n=1 Tax=Alkalimonas mucilaginosa TaxID=3057676 RepID=A0ABU7JDA5_9GAMM|nr:TonB-dependent receptor [Alkalimonas sp. MEB004]MEE2023634.1 TonB-dependent receptor [Alkalimonas sp. MEB004]
MRNSKSFLKPSALAILIACSFSAQAMATQQIRGTVLNAQGEPVKNARIHVHGRQQYIYTDANGNFQLHAPANAELHITAPGFDGKYLQVSDPTSVQAITLQPGGQIERMIVSASGIHKYNLDMATPVTVLSGEQLSRRTEPTIGETLKKQPGVHANYFGPVASSPVIRGLDGPRVRILNNGLDTGDVSRIGPDHAIMADALTTEQIEVLRGPATLLYGSGAIGGVVNVVDNRIPRQLRPQSDTVVETRYNSVSDEKTIALNHDGSHNQVAWHLDGLHRNADDYKVPHFTNSDGEHENEIDNSWLETSSLNAGLSYIGSRGLIGFHAGRTESEYGIPGHDHAHGHDDHDDHDHSHGHDHGHNHGGHDDDVFAKARQNRFNLAGEYYDPFAGIETIAFNLGYTDYEHSEIEDGHVATFFGSKTLESRITLEHEPLAGWHGIFGYHLLRNDYTASGEEAFTPDTETTSHAFFMLEEKRFGDLTLQLGGRLERVKYHADGIEFGHHEHDHSHGHEHDHGHSDGHEHVEARFTAYSASAGLVWEFQPGFSWAFAASRSERAPSAAELYANGAHLATGTYELGLAYRLDHHDGDIEPNRDRFQKEIANNFDLTFRKFDGNLSLTYNFFYNRVNNYIYLANTGLDIDDLGGHDHGHDHSHGHDHDHSHDGHSDHSFPVLQYRQDDAVLYGFEFELGYYLDQMQSVHLFADQVRAKVRGGDDLPRIPPMKLGAEYRYQAQNWSGEVGLTRYARQNRVSPLENRTAGYTLLDATFNYYFDVSDVEMTAFVRGTNLTNRLGFVHSSFIKDDAPLPGRAITLGLRARF